ncbi:hypothetical protein DK926_05025 [Rhodococcus sp. Eu-32]|uniref:hypothetical protein n=1 Tax=Rhodococcus sp. Eu-32 TaxID=1017319 RepID=UPI000DF3209B|nr:hypothetical protein [Rhodococcus sp. Eu-32]RRQ29246.1 hypothetical protein DK926_05025 [Rhodococcus sp. Eu-32]
MSTESARGSAWSTAAVIVGIVAAGTVVAGLLNEPQSDAISIPGCDEVIQPEEMERINGGIVGGGDASWLSEPEIQALSDALVQSVPEGVVVEQDPSWPPFAFESTTGGEEVTAVGKVSVDGYDGQLVVRVLHSDDGPGPCFAGTVDERRTDDDGIVLDISDRRVIAYVPDGSKIDVSSDVLTRDQMITVATDPGLRVGDS